MERTETTNGPKTVVIDDASLKALRSERTADIRQQLKRLHISRYIYLLLEPVEDVIRYVGCCTQPDERFRAHVSKNASPQVRQWVDGLKQRGQLPRMQIVGTIGQYGYWYEQIVMTSSLGEVVESEIIERLTKGRWVGNVKMPSNLLNVLR